MFFFHLFIYLFIFHFILLFVHVSFSFNLVWSIVSILLVLTFYVTLFCTLILYVIYNILWNKHIKRQKKKYILLKERKNTEINYKQSYKKRFDWEIKDWKDWKRLTLVWNSISEEHHLEANQSFSCLKLKATYLPIGAQWRQAEWYVEQQKLGSTKNNV